MCYSHLLLASHVLDMASDRSLLTGLPWSPVVAPCALQHSSPTGLRVHSPNCKSTPQPPPPWSNASVKGSSRAVHETGGPRRSVNELESSDPSFQNQTRRKTVVYSSWTFEGPRIVPRPGLHRSVGVVPGGICHTWCVWAIEVPSLTHKDLKTVLIRDDPAFGMGWVVIQAGAVLVQ